MLEGSWNDTFLTLNCLAALHCMSLSCSCLAIGKYCSIITLENTFDNRQCSMVKDTFLFAIRLEGHVKAEHSLFFTNIFSVSDKYLSSLGFYMNNCFIASLYFILWHRPAADGDFYALIFIAHLNLEIIYDMISNRSYNYFIQIRSSLSKNLFFLRPMSKYLKSTLGFQNVDRFLNWAIKFLIFFSWLIIRHPK